MNLIDSSAWIAFFTDQPVARHFIEPLQQSGEVAVPTIVLHEVFKFLLRNHSKRVALSAAARMRTGFLVPLDATLAMHAAECGIEFKLPQADSIIYATAQRFDATLWTQDSDFDGLPGVQYFPQNYRG